MITAQNGINVIGGIGIDIDAGGINVDAGIATFPSVKVNGSGVPTFESTSKLHLKTAANNNVVIGSQTSDFNNQDEVDSGNTTVLNVGIVTANEYFGTFKGTIDAGSISDKIQQGDTKAQVVDNGSDGHFLVETDGTERFRIDDDGKIFVHGQNANGSNNTSSLLTFGKKLNIYGTSSSEGISVVRYSASYGAYGLNVGRSRSNTFGTNTKVVDGDELGHVSFWGSNDSTFYRAAQITGECDGGVTSGATDMPGALSFRTTPDAASSPVEKMRITSEGYVQIKYAGSATTGGAPLYVGVTGKDSITYAGGNNDTACLRIEDEGGNDNYYHGIELRTKRSGDARIYAHDRGENTVDLVFATDNSGTIEERVRITSGGDVGIGTDDPTGVNALTNNTATLAVGNIKADSIITTSLSSGGISTTTGTGDITLSSSDFGKLKYSTGSSASFKVPASVFEPGNFVSFYNNSTNIHSVSPQSNVDIFLSGSNVSVTFNNSVKLSPRALATLTCIVGGGSPQFVISGGGVYI